MAIDKIIPRFLVSDKDERLLEEGAMIDALNVSISENGDGSEGVIKNVKGTTAIDPSDGSELGGGVTVVGQVSDPQRNAIYFFAADNTGSTEHAIYRYDTVQNEYEIVFKNSWLDFDPNGFVKADVLNAAFQQDGNIQTVLYFTDNDNQPRKINVERAMSGEFDDLSSSKLDHVLRCVKSAPIDVPTFSFDTDDTIEVNNFTKSLFQFALQYVYTDGEESAISGYSALAYPEVTPLQNIENSSTGKFFYDDNVCDIDTHWSSNVLSAYNIPDVEKVRILARNGNTGAFFVVDEFNPNENLVRQVFETSQTVYNKDTGVYRFYNDGVYAAVDTNLVNKLYDNVPLKSQGQTIAGNRLFYSDYVEGFENVDVSASITVGYSADRFGGTNTLGSSPIVEHAANSERGVVAIDCSSILGAANFPAGSKTKISFSWDPEGSFTQIHSTEYAIESNAIATGDNQPFVIGFGNKSPGGTFSTSGGVILKKSSSDFQFEITVTNAEEITASEFAAILNEQISTMYWSKTYTASEIELVAQVVSSDSAGYFAGDPFPLDSGSYNVTTAWSFNSTVLTGAQNDVVLVIPTLYFASIDISGSNDGGAYSVGAQTFNGSQIQYNINNTADGPYPFDANSWHYNYNAATAFYLENESISSSAFFSQSTFKAGCTHDLGVVYYDKHNRSGNVNKIGSFYVEPFGASNRSGNNGASFVTVNFTSDPPPWAERYQIVYPGMNSYSSVVQYTTAGGFYDETSSGVVDETNKRVYVSLDTLTRYKGQKNALRNYSFTEGDKLRVIRYDAQTLADDGSPSTAETVTYPRANDGSIIEFNVVGVTIGLPDGVTFINQHETSGFYDGLEYLVLEAPAVAAGVEVEVSGGSTALKYTGFDWFSLSGQTYPDGSGGGTENYWGNKCVVELLTPRKQTSEKVYYEIGNSRRIGGYKQQGVNDHGPAFVVNSGDLHFTPISCLTPWRDGHPGEHIDGTQSGWNHFDPGHWRYENVSLESQAVSDFFDSESWDRGRAHVVYENAAEIRRFNGLTYSDAYEEDVANLSLSSFNPSLANFYSLESRFGAIEYIGSYNDDIVALQKNKLSLVPINKNIIEYAGGSANVAVSTDVVNQPRYSSGDYGTSGHPESVLIQDNSVFFVDESRQAVLGFTGGQLVPISEKNMSSFFEGFFTNGHTKYVSGYDPRESAFYVTGLGGTAETIGYDAARGVWQSKYSFTPDVYANQNNMLYTAKYTSGNNIFWKHDNTTDYNTFYGGDVSPSVVQVVSKLSPSRVKVFNALSYEGDSEAWDISTNGLETNLGCQTDGITTWDEREGSYYASVPRDKSSNSTSQKIFLGSLTNSGDNLTFTSNVRLNRQPIPLGSQTIIDSASNTHSVDISSVSGNSITFASSVSIADGNANVILDSATNGDSMRGHWMKIKMENSSSVKHELYCINTHITDSKSHHPLGG